MKHELEPSTPEPDISALYADPYDLVADPGISASQKREILASWASDARAVTDSPALRQLDNGAVVEIDDILAALRQLDEVPQTTASSPPVYLSALRRRGRAKLSRLKRAWRRNRDDDDDPPPCPVAAQPPKPLPLLDAVGLSAA